MAQVPYSPVPTAAPSSQGVQGINVRAVPDAFGAGIADETKKLGQTLEKAGDEIFTRAVGIQQQLNDAEAKEADAQYVMKSGDMFAEYETLQGKAAMDARPQFIENLRKLREDTRAGLSNDASRRLFDSSTRQNFARTVFATASYAAKQARDYTIKASEAQVSAAREDTLRNPNDEGAFNENLTRTKEQVKFQGQQRNLPPQAIDNNVRDAESNILADRVISISRADPFKAFDMMKENQDKFTSKDRERVEKIVVDGKRTVRSRLISSEVLFGIDPEKPEKTLQQAQEEALEKAAPYMEDDAMMADAVKDRVATDWAKMRGVKYETERVVKNTINGLITGLNDPNGALPTTVEELVASPEGRAAYDKADNTFKKAIQAQLKRNADVKTKLSEHGEAIRLQGLSHNDPEAFLLESPGTNSKLSNSDQRKFLTKQQEISRKVETNPFVRQAMSVLGPDLRAAGITRDRKDEFDKFTGALIDAIALEVGDAKRPLKPEEYRKIGARLMQANASESWGEGKRWHGMGTNFFPGSERMFEQGVPEKDQTLIKDAWMKKFGTEPKEEQIQRMYVQKKYQELYGKKAKPKDESRVGAPLPSAAQ